MLALDLDLVVRRRPRMTDKTRWLAAALVVPALAGCNAPASRAQAPAETFVATASVQGTSGTQTAPVTIVLTRFTTDQERTTVADALKTGGTPAVVQRLKAMDDVGYLEVGERRSPLKYAYARSTGSGRLITVISPSPIVYLGAARPNAKPKAGFDLALALLDLPSTGSGSGELAPAAKVKLTDKGTIETEDYGAEVVRLTDAHVKK
jgi:hypothetical protein